MQCVTVRNSGDVQSVLHTYKNLPDQKLGQMLLDEGLISQAQLDEALARQRVTRGTHLGQMFIEKGVVTQEQVDIAMAKKLGIPFVKIQEFQAEINTINRLSAELAMQLNVFPLAEINGKLIVALEDPFNQKAIEALRFNTKMNVEAVKASSQDISVAVHKHYGSVNEDEALEDMQMDSMRTDSKANESTHIIEQEAHKKPIVRLLNAILLQGIIRNASDVNIRPEKDRVNIYYRIDGKMHYSQTISKPLLAPLVSRIKITGEMDISERRLPQDGHARIVRANQSIDLRISVIPTVCGESVVIRILDKAAGMKPLEGLGIQSKEVEIIKGLVAKPHGLFLVTGPTGSGKSTTLCAVLNEVKKRDLHILTVEDPVEYDIDGIEQVQVASDRGYTFAAVLRNFLRHDPDVIMVGEIRDEETARVASKAALTGHLVFSTLHTNTAVGTVTRLTEMGIEPYLLGSTLLGVISQRLVRLNCPHCLREEQVNSTLRSLLNLAATDVFYRGKGCQACNHIGYRGRTTVCELLPVTPEIALMISQDKPAVEITQKAVEQGMVRITEQAMILAWQRKTSIEEVLSVRVD